MLQLVVYSCANLDVMETETDVASSRDRSRRVKINSKGRVPGLVRDERFHECLGRWC